LGQRRSSIRLLQKTADLCRNPERILEKLNALAMGRSLELQ
jgi:hypothetical protein